MQLESRAFWIAKRGHSPEEYEDAFSPGEYPIYRGEKATFNIADGASESSYARQWAKILVNAANNGLLANDFATTALPKLQSQWAAEVLGRELPWYAEAKAKQGAFAAWLVLEIIESAEGRTWSAGVVGDCCLLHIRNRNLIESFPMKRSEEFHNHPRLLSSIATQDNSISIARMNGIWHPDDQFYLMTDALAAWFLREVESGNKPWEIIAQINQQNAFCDMIETLRNAEALRNDDCTLLTISARVED